MWSPDGLYYVVSARSLDYPPAEGPLYIQQVNGQSLGKSWKLDDVTVSHVATLPQDFQWQP